MFNEHTREGWRFTWLERLWQDVRYGARMFGRSLGFSIVAVLSLALVIGANSTVFSVLNATLFQALPYEDPTRLVWVREIKIDQPARWRKPTHLIVSEWSERAESLEKVALATTYPQAVTLSARGQAEPGSFHRVTHTFFPLLGVEAQLGRTFTSKDPSREIGEPVLLSDSYWRRRFGADPEILGEELVVAGQISVIVGVLPPGFQFGVLPQQREADVWQSLSLRPRGEQESRWFDALARLKLGVSVEQAQLELEAVTRHLQERDSSVDENWRTDVQLLSEVKFSWLQESFALLIGIALLVLLIGCANVANLQLARSRKREKEISIRVSLGANRLRLIRQLLTESILLSSLGGILGLLLTFWGIGLLVKLAPAWWALRMETITIDVRVVAFTAIVSLLTGAVFGLVPALRASRPDVYESLKEGGWRSASTAGPRLRSLLIVFEVSLTLILLVGAGLMVHSFLNLQEEDPGYDPSNLLTVRIFLQGPEYWERQAPEGMKVGPRTDQFWEELLLRTKALPGVQSTATIGSSGAGCEFRIVGQEPKAQAQRPRVIYETVSPGYFHTLGVPVLKGRTPTEHDAEGSAWVAVVNEAMAGRFFPDESPLGKLVQLDLGGSGGPGVNVGVHEEPQVREIVGVVGSIRPYGLAWGSVPTVYVPHRQHIWEFPSMGAASSVTRKDLYLRAAFRPLALAPVVEEIIAEIDPDQAPSYIHTQEQYLANSIDHWRFWMRLFLFFAAVALILVVVGVFGVIAGAVSERTHEIGVRMAIGARRGDVFALVIKQALKVTLIGLAIGMSISLALSRVVASLMYQMSPVDPLTYAAAALLMITVALVACYLPARWATQVDPVVALKQE